MYVNGVRADDVRNESVLEHAKFVRRDAEQGEETFRVLCSNCHTTDGYLAIRPLVQKKSSAALVSTIERLDTWRGRRMPPFTGNEDEKYALAVYLARLGGGVITPRAPAIDGAAIFDSHYGACHGADSEWQIAPRVAGKSEDQLYDALGRLPQLNEMMPPFEGTDAERRALAKYLGNQKAEIQKANHERHDPKSRSAAAAGASVVAVGAADADVFPARDRDELRPRRVDPRRVRAISRTLAR
jgi:mono/diheme cytochrome c family protein